MTEPRRTPESETKVAAYSELLAANRSRVFGYVYAMLHNMADAEDVFQQTTVLLWEKFEEYEPGTDFGSWALKIAYYNVKNFQRTQNRKHRFFSEAVMEEVAESFSKTDEHDDTGRLDALAYCVGKLAPRHRELLEQRYSKGLPVKEIAASHGKSDAAMSMLLSRVRKLLHQCLSTRTTAG